MPEMVREAMLKPWLEANLQGEDFSIRFYAVDGEMIVQIGAEVRGNGNPLPALRAIFENTGWSMIDDATNTPIELTSGIDPNGWERFRKWRDKAIDKMTRSE